jgi:hypothetical protein
MQLSPGLHESSLPGGQPAADHLHGVNPNDSHLILVVGMEMRSVVRRTRFGIHPDDDAKKRLSSGTRSLHPLRTPDFNADVRRCCGA